MNIKIKEELQTGIHRVTFKVVFRNKYIVTREDRHFSYKRLNAKLKALCQKAKMQVDDILNVEIK